MKIDQQNYETLLLDYIEGRLDPLTTAELENFLSFHPELKKELEGYEEIRIAPENITYNHKKKLKKFDFHTTVIEDKNFEDFCIAFGEHLLSPTKINELFSYIEQHQHLKKEFDIYKEIYIQPQKIVFDQKQNLYRKTISSPLTKSIVRWSSLAAGILAIAGIYSLFIENNKSTNNLSYYNVNIEHKKVPKTLITAKNERVKANSEYAIVKNRFERPKYKTNHNNLPYNELPNNNIIDTTTDRLAEQSEEIANIPTIAVTNIENPIDFSSEITLDYNVYNAENIKIKKETLLRNLTTKFSHNINLLKNNQGKISLIKVAQLGLTGINKLTNSNMQLSEKTDTAGNVTALSFESGLFEYHKVKSD